MGDQDKFAVLRRARRVWAVASIHGECDRLRLLHENLYPKLIPGDRLVYLGNMIGQGSDTRETVREILTFRRALLARPLSFAYDVAYLRGAQEEIWRKLLQLQFAPNPGEVLAWMLDHGAAATLDAYGGKAADGFAAARDGARALTRWTSGLITAMQRHAGHYPFMSILRRAAVTDDGHILFIHAGLDLDKPLGTQGDALWWSRMPLERFDQAYGGYLRIVRGFDPAHPGLAVGRIAASLDGGCGFGGPLIAGCIDVATGAICDAIEC